MKPNEHNAKTRFRFETKHRPNESRKSHFVTNKKEIIQQVSHPVQTGYGSRPSVQGVVRSSPNRSRAITNFWIQSAQREEK